MLLSGGCGDDVFQLITQFHTFTFTFTFQVITNDATTTRKDTSLSGRIQQEDNDVHRYSCLPLKH